MSRAPLQHQVNEINKSKDQVLRALFWEQRCQKTGVVIRTAAEKFRDETIDAVLSIAFPSDVHLVWRDEWPLDWPEELAYKLIAWRSAKMGTQAAKADLEELLKFKGCAVLTMNCEALLTKNAWNYLQRFLKYRRVLVCADEASWAASPNAARTKRLLAIGRHPNVVMKRILDGTPADESPLNLYAPCAFLDPKLLGFSSYFAFRNRYAVMEEAYAAGGRTFKKVVGYKNLDELQHKLSKFSSRLRRSDISDAPPKTYSTIYFQMTPKQREVYDRLRQQYLATVGNEAIPVEHVLKRGIRLQQAARNYFPPEERGVPCPKCHNENDPECPRCDGFGIVVETTKLHRIDDRNPALDALLQHYNHTPSSAVVFAMFRQDARDVHQAIPGSVLYTGEVHPEDRDEAYQGFRQGRYDTIVATIGSGLQRGKDLTRADTLYYYSNSYSLRARRQSEDRAEGVLRTRSTAIVDLVAEDTNDIAIIEALRAKRAIAATIMGDQLDQWI